MRILSKAVLFITIMSGFPFLLQSEVWKEPLISYTLEPGVPGGKLVFATTSDPKSFNPVIAKETSTTGITAYMFEGLTDQDPLTLEVRPRLAESWKTDDGLVWIFYLRQDVEWSDGERFTADDVVFTYNELVYNPEIPTSSRDILTIDGKQIKVEKIDDHTVRFTLPCLFAPFLQAAGGTEILPRHIYLDQVKSGKFNSSMGLDSSPQEIVGCGPFRLKNYVPGERVILERNPFYWKKDTKGQSLPYLDEIVFVIVQNQDSELLRFLDGEIDYFSMRPQDLAILGPRQKKDGFTIYNTGPARSTNFVVFNQHPGRNPKTNMPFVKPYKLKWFQDENFRKAISYAINRKKIITVAYNSLGVELDSPVSSANPLFYNADVIRYSYAPDKAGALLSDLGFFDKDKDGILEDEQGNPLEINFFTNADNTLRLVIATLIKKDLEQVGIKINYLPLEFNHLVSKLVSTHEWEMILLGLTGGIDPHFGKNVWAHKGQLHAWNQSKMLLADWEKEIDDIFNQGVKIMDPDERKKVYDRWQYIVSDKLPFIYTVTGYTMYAVKNKFGNVYPTVYGGAFSHVEHVFLLDHE